MVWTSLGWRRVLSFTARLAPRNRLNLLQKAIPIYSKFGLRLLGSSVPPLFVPTQRRESGLCWHIKAAVVRYSNMPCRTSLFTATPGRMLKQSAVVHSPCFMSPVAKYSCFEEFLLSLSKLLSTGWVYTSGRCCWKEIIVIAALRLITASCTYYFELCLLLWGTGQLGCKSQIQKCIGQQGLFIMWSNFWPRKL